MSALFADAKKTALGFEIISRRCSGNKATFPAEIISCNINGKIITLLCKYESIESIRQNAIEYEGMIYKEIINHLSINHLKSYGTFCFNQNEKKQTCMVLDYIENSLQLIAGDPSAFSEAAKWIANFHHYFEGKSFPFVKVYNQGYYLSLINYTEQLVNKLSQQFQWLTELCCFFKTHVPILLAAPQTIIHGEFYGKNILLKNGLVFPVDWETAAIGPAEIDLAALMDGKDEARINFAYSDYLGTRWPNKNDVPVAFKQRLLLSKIYYQFRWIEDWKLEASELEKWMKSKNFSDKLYQLWQQAEGLT